MKTISPERAEELRRRGARYRAAPAAEPAPAPPAPTAQNTDDHDDLTREILIVAKQVADASFDSAAVVQKLSSLVSENEKTAKMLIEVLEKVILASQPVPKRLVINRSRGVLTSIDIIPIPKGELN